MSDTLSYQPLIDLISRLEGKDKKTCETALYHLTSMDTKEIKLFIEVQSLRAENEKLTSAYKNGYHDALEAAADLTWKILTEIEGIDFEVPAKIRELHATTK